MKGIGITAHGVPRPTQTHPHHHHSVATLLYHPPSSRPRRVRPTFSPLNPRHVEAGQSISSACASRSHSGTRTPRHCSLGTAVVAALVAALVAAVVTGIITALGTALVTALITGPDSPWTTLKSSVQRLYLFGPLLGRDSAFELERRGELSALLREVTGQHRKLLDLLRIRDRVLRVELAQASGEVPFPHGALRVRLLDRLLIRLRA
mmetsp:Transcript_45071/g.118150  ORF Transcript_45071/g.118150 Transcript_45071/m.118150 type:complete len:207 (+) Transcript_45071:2559-3179(+)